MTVPPPADASRPSQPGIVVGRPRGMRVGGEWPRPTIPAATARARPAEPAKYAVLVVHGVGQQTKFETLDLAVRGLIREAGRTQVGAPRARLVTLGEERLSRVELTLQTDGGTRELHVYEAYWAPLTEGQVKLREVTFLLSLAALNGIRNGTAVFRRWLFGRYEQFPPELRTVVYLLVGLAALLSLVVINGAIGVVAATRWGVGARQAIGDGLYGDLSTAFNFLALCALAFALVLALGRSVRRSPALVRAPLGVVTVVLFGLVLSATVAAGVAVPLLTYVHRQAGLADGLTVFAAAFGRARVDRFNAGVELLVVALVLVAALVAVAWLVLRLVNGWRGQAARGRRLTLGLLGLFTLFVAGIAIEGAWLGLSDWGAAVRETGGAGRGAVWLLLVAASLLVRRVIVQYVGDVVAYVQPHVLDRFDALRDRIKDTVTRRTEAIYGAVRHDGTPEYAGVALIAHSLGSVIAYDTLNRLLTDDELARGGRPGAHGTRPSLEVARRTVLFLTLGSPLDKTAFAFGSQRAGSELRSALAATVQPLILRRECRPFPWVNIHSWWDPISGPLDYYDPPAQAGTGPTAAPVDNRLDPSATTLFFAHLEYWEGPLVFRTLLAALPSPWTHAERGSPETSCPHPGLPAARGTTGLSRIPAGVGRTRG